MYEAIFGRFQIVTFKSVVSDNVTIIDEEKRSMPKKECLSPVEVIMIARMTAENYKLQMPDESEIMQNYKSGKYTRVPVLVRCKRGTLWVDRYYVAFQLAAGDVHYTYLTKEHMKEEVDSYHEVQGDLPKDIEHCFMVGVAGMKKRNTHIWVAKDFSEGLNIDC